MWVRHNGNNIMSSRAVLSNRMVFPVMCIWGSDKNHLSNQENIMKFSSGYVTCSKPLNTLSQNFCPCNEGKPNQNGNCFNIVILVGNIFLPGKNMSISEKKSEVFSFYFPMNFSDKPKSGLCLEPNPRVKTGLKPFCGLNHFEHPLWGHQAT